MILRKQRKGNVLNEIWKKIQRTISNQGVEFLPYKKIRMIIKWRRYSQQAQTNYMCMHFALSK